MSLDSILAQKVLTFADDELVIAHRNSEWCGHAPILEEDIAFANLALDELGHAALWYRLYAELVGQDPETYPDHLIYFREPFEFRCSQFAAMPKGDWAFSMLRQYLWDAVEAVRLEALAGAGHELLADTARKIQAEEIYHLRHTEAWVRRLGLGTEESNRRMQAALDELWPYTGQLFDSVEGQKELIAINYPTEDSLRSGWDARVVPFLQNASLTIPDTPMRTLDRAYQSQHLVDILAELQQVARLDPGAGW